MDAGSLAVCVHVQDSFVGATHTRTAQNQGARGVAVGLNTEQRERLTLHYCASSSSKSASPLPLPRRAPPGLSNTPSSSVSVRAVPGVP